MVRPAASQVAPAVLNEAEAAVVVAAVDVDSEVKSAAPELHPPATGHEQIPSEGLNCKPAGHGFLKGTPLEHV